MKKSVVCLFVAVLAISVLVPLSLKSFSETALQVIDHIAFIMAALFSAVAAWAAYSLYDKYGVEKKIVNKSLDVVLRFVDEMEKTKILIHGGDNNGQYALMLKFGKKGIIDDDFMKRYLDDKLLFKLSYGYEQMQLYYLMQDAFMPKEISSKFRKLSLQTITEATDEAKATGFAIVTGANDVKHYNSGTDQVGYMNGEEMTLGQFLKHYEEVGEAIKKWLTDHQVDDKNLNF